MVEYITLEDVKAYLGLSDVSQYDSKLQTITDGVNYDVSDFMSDAPSDSRIVLACLRLSEHYWVKTAGAKSESEGSGASYKISFEKSQGWPSDVLGLLNKSAGIESIESHANLELI